MATMDRVRAFPGTLLCVMCAAGVPLSYGTSIEPVVTVQWSLPGEAPQPPQSEAEKEYGKTHGRKLPEPELMQPRLDAQLSPYRPLARNALAGEFRAAASDVLPDLVRRWIDAFERLYPGVHIDLSPPYAGSLGAQELARGKLDFAFVSRELRPADIAGFRAAFGHEPLSVPICGGSHRHYGFLDTVVVVASRNNPIEHISFAQLDAIYSSTDLRGGRAAHRWGDVGVLGDWAGKPIHAYGIRPWNGFEEFVRQKVLSAHGARGEWRPDVHFDEVVFPVAGRVATDPLGIGYTGLAYVDAGVKVLSVGASPDGPFFAPTGENVASGKYPLSRLVYFNVNREPGRPLPAAAGEFLKYIVSRDGQQIVLDQAVFMPLRADQALRSRAMFD